MRLGPAIALPLLLFAGCSRVGFQELPDAAARPEQQRRDAPRSDGPPLERDLPAPEARASDAASDAAVKDAAKDQPAAKDLPQLADKPKPDTRPPDTRPPDTRPPDTMPTPDLPTTVGNIVIATSAAEIASCAAGQTAIGGGGYCANGILIASVPILGGWRASCSAGPISSYAVCVGSPLSAPASFTTVTAASAVFDVPCPGTDRLIGGGCQCGGGALLHGTAPWSNASWRCACSAAGAHAGHVVCIPQALALSLGVGRTGSQSNTTQPTMTCPLTTPKALGGGCYSGGSPPGTTVAKSAPSGGTGWFCKLAAVFSNSAWAMCAK